MGNIIYDNTGDISLLNLCGILRHIDQTPLPTTEAARVLEIQERLKLQKTNSINYTQDSKKRFLFGKSAPAPADEDA